MIERRKEQLRTVAAWAAARFPAVFSDRLSPVPIAIGAGLIIQRAAKEDIGASRAASVRFLRWWCRGAAYERALAAPGAMRHTLYGKPVEPVSEEHAKQARRVLAARAGKHDDTDEATNHEED